MYRNTYLELRKATTVTLSSRQVIQANNKFLQITVDMLIVLDGTTSTFLLSICWWRVEILPYRCHRRSCLHLRLRFSTKFMNLCKREERKTSTWRHPFPNSTAPSWALPPTFISSPDELKCGRETTVLFFFHFSLRFLSAPSSSRCVGVRSSEWWECLVIPPTPSIHTSRGEVGALDLTWSHWNLWWLYSVGRINWTAATALCESFVWASCLPALASPRRSSNMWMRNVGWYLTKFYGKHAAEMLWEIPLKVFLDVTFSDTRENLCQRVEHEV